MSLKIFPLLLLSSAVLAGPIIENEGCRDTDGEMYSLEDDILQLLELLRKMMKEGNPEYDIQPMEPLILDFLSTDFFIEDTQLDLTLKDTVIANLSDFRVENLTVTLSPKMQLKANILFPEISIVGWHKIKGILFDEIPIDHVGSHRISMVNATVSVNLVVRPKAGIPQITDLTADFLLESISVVCGNPRENEVEKEIPTNIVKDVLDRFRLRYLPLLLVTGKLYINDLIVRLMDTSDEDLLRISSLLEENQLLFTKLELISFR